MTPPNTALRAPSVPLPLSYCTNVHPGLTVEQVESGLTRYTRPVRERLGTDLAAGLWLAAPVVRELLGTPDGPRRFAARLRELGLPCYTLNAFPFGDFHSDRVKEAVYVPDWTDPARRDYTLDCARILVELLPEGVDGSISTVPLGFKRLAASGEFLPRCLNQLRSVARELDALRQRTGKAIRLAIEPEPLCVLETTAETVAFFARLRESAASDAERACLEDMLGVCYDVCHQSVEFEDVAQSLRQLAEQRIRINKVHLSCALQVDRPGELAHREALARYAEPRYLHQTFARGRDGVVRSIEDLSREFALHPPVEFAESPIWRVHFHVPVDAERLGPLSTTRPDLARAISAVKELDYRPHLEVETYTWEVLPDGNRTPLVEGLARELAATAELIGEDQPI